MEILPRCLPAVLPVCATMNPTNPGWVTPARTRADTGLPMVVLPCLLLKAWVFSLRAFPKAPERFGLAAALVAALAGDRSISVGSGQATAWRRNGRRCQALDGAADRTFPEQ